MTTSRQLALSRRHFITSAAAVTLGFGGLSTLVGRGAWASELATGAAAGFGPLLPDMGKVFDLPEGFTYTVFSRWGETMEDGFKVPARHDGMAAFPGKDGLTVIVRNHENHATKPAEGPFGEDLALLPRAEGRLYDHGSGLTPSLGGTTTLLYDTHRQKFLRHRLSLAGTERNCAGGPTPWGTWVTCEESVLRAGNNMEQDHGYNFEVPADIDAPLVQAVPLKAMGRFNHEAIAVDPRTGIVYQTEDRNDGLIYRFLPTTPGKLAGGGKLQAMVLRGAPSFDTRNWRRSAAHVPVGQQAAVQWIDIEDVESPNDDLRRQGFAKGAALFARGEGMWWGNDAVYFACTNGGREERGQVWKYVPSPHEGAAREADEPGKLVLFVEPNDSGLIDNADNLCVAPWGDVILVEDGSGEQFIVGITPKGRIYKLGRNARGDSELAGVCYSPDGSTMFVNIQSDGLTVAITGPWHKARA